MIPAEVFVQEDRVCVYDVCPVLGVRRIELLLVRNQEATVTEGGKKPMFLMDRMEPVFHECTSFKPE